MNLDIRIIQHREFLKLTADGDIDLEESKRILLRLTSLNKLPSHRDLLIDCRASIVNLTITEVMELVRLMTDHRELFRNKMAIVIEPSLRLERAAVIELYAQNRGFSVSAFNSFEAAILWLRTID